MMTAITVVLVVLILAATAALALVLLYAGRDTDEPEAADAPEPSSCPVDEHFKSSPRVVAGSDIDRQKSIEKTRVDIVFGGIVADTLADLDTHLSDFYVLPEGDR